MTRLTIIAVAFVVAVASLVWAFHSGRAAERSDARAAAAESRLDTTNERIERQEDVEQSPADFIIGILSGVRSGDD